MKRIISKIRYVQALTLPEKFVVLQSLLMLPLVAISLRFVGFNQMLRLLGFERKSSLSQNKSTLNAHQIAILVYRAATNLPIHNTCLVRSLVTWRLLRNRGIDSHLLIGVNKSYQEFAAHAWIEYEGIPLAEASNIRDMYSVIHTTDAEHITFHD